MKNICAYLVCIICIQLFSLNISKAQSVTGDLSVLKAPATAINIDGNLKEWGDSLQYFNAELNTRYAITNDKENLYFAIRIDDPTEAARVLKAGISFGVDPKGKKKAVYTITFPVNTQQAAKPYQPNMGELTQADRDELHRQIITSLRGIKVEGFKDIEGDMITTSNTYGIKTAIDYDAKGSLVCEAAIPFKFLPGDNNPKTEWNFNIKVNGVTNSTGNRDDGDIKTNLGGKSMGGGGRGGGMGGSRGGRGGSTGGLQPTSGTNGAGALSKSIDFSGKFRLAGVQ